MHRMVAALLVASSCAGMAQAQTAPPPGAQDVLTLDESLAQAGASSPSTDAASAGVRAAEAGRVVAGLRPNPSISAETENVVGTGPYRGFNEAETTVTFSMPIELGGKRGARIGVAEARTGRAQLDAAITLADLRLRVTQSYIEAVAAERRLSVARDQLQITNEALRVARDRIAARERRKWTQRVQLPRDRLELRPMRGYVRRGGVGNVSMQMTQLVSAHADERTRCAAQPQ